MRAHWRPNYRLQQTALHAAGEPERLPPEKFRTDDKSLPNARRHRTFIDVPPACRGGNRMGLAVS